MTLVLASSTSILIGPSTPLPPAHGSLTQPGAVAAACSCGVSGEAAVTVVAASPLWLALLEPAEDDEPGERGSSSGGVDTPLALPLLWRWCACTVPSGCSGGCFW